MELLDIGCPIRPCTGAFRANITTVELTCFIIGDAVTDTLETPEFLAVEVDRVAELAVTNGPSCHRDHQLQTTWFIWRQFWLKHHVGEMPELGLIRLQAHTAPIFVDARASGVHSVTPENIEVW